MPTSHDSPPIGRTWFLSATIFIGTLIYANQFDNGVESPKLVLLLIGVSLYCGFLGLTLAVKKERLRLDRYRAIVLSIVALGALVVFASFIYGFTSYFARELLPLYLCATTLFLVCSLGLVSRHEVEGFIYAFVCAAFINSLVGLYQYYFGPIDAIREVAPPAGLFGNRNFSSEIALSATPLCLWIYLRAKTSALKLSWAIVLGILLGYTIICFARATLLVAILISPLMILALIRARRSTIQNRSGVKHFLPLLASLALTLLLPLLPAHEGPKRNSIIKQKISVIDNYRESKDVFDIFQAQSRWAVWVNSSQAWLERPMFGHGFGTWRSVYYGYAQSKLPDRAIRRGKDSHHAHNFYVEQLVELGIVGSGLLFAFLAIILLPAARKIILPKQGTAPPERLLLYFASCLAILMMACFSMPLELPVLPFVLSVLLASIIGLSFPLEESEGSRELPRAATMAIGILICISSVYCIYRANQIRIVEIKAEKVDHLFLAKDFEGVKRYGREVLALDPHHLTVNNRLALIYLDSNLDSSITYLKNIEAAYPERPINSAFLATCYTRKGDKDKALEYWRRLLKVVPSDEMGLQGAYQLTYELGHFDEALKYAEKLVELNPENETYIRNLNNLKRRLSE